MNAAHDFKVWFREDLARIVRGLLAASQHRNDDERAGFQRALCAFCLTVGVDPATVLQRAQSSMLIEALPVARVIDSNPDW